MDESQAHTFSKPDRHKNPASLKNMFLHLGQIKVVRAHGLILGRGTREVEVSMTLPSAPTTRLHSRCHLRKWKPGAPATRLVETLCI